MGQAKLRGSLEERRAAAIARDVQLAEEARKEHLRAELAMTPEQKKKRHELRMLLAGVGGIIASTDPEYTRLLNDKGIPTIDVDI